MDAHANRGGDCPALPDFTRLSAPNKRAGSAGLESLTPSAVANRFDSHRLNVLFEGTRDGTLLISGHAEIVYASPTAARLLGYSEFELAHTSIGGLIHPDDVDRSTEVLASITSEAGRMESGTFRFLLGDGSWRTFQITAANHVDVEDVAGIVVHFWRVNEPRYTAQVFDGVEDKFRILIENAVHITAIVDVNGYIRYVSPAVERMLGYPPESLQREHVSKLVHAEDMPAASTTLEGCMRETGAVRLLQFRARHRDGSWRVLEAITTNRFDDPVIAGLVIDARDVTERKWSADRLERSLEALLAIHDVSGRLGTNLEYEAIGAALLEGAQRVVAMEAAILFLRKTGGHLTRTQVVGPKPLTDAARRSHSARSVRRNVMLTGVPQCFRVQAFGDRTVPLDAWVLPLRVHERTVGMLEVYGANIADGSGNAELGILANQAASALERARLYREAAERERRLEELVRRLLLAQEEERRSVAYEVHDGLAQLAAATQQHLEAFAARYRSANPERRDDLAQTLSLASRTVLEARRVIAGLRPTVLDDFGLAAAISYELQGLRAEGWQIEYTDAFGPARLEATIETTLFRVVQEALANVRKHAQTNRVAVSLEHTGQTVHLEIRDWGRGFRRSAARSRSGPSERVGLAGMQERISLLRGRCSIHSRPGAGVRISVEVPLPAERKSTRRR